MYGEEAGGGTEPAPAARPLSPLAHGMPETHFPPEKSFAGKSPLRRLAVFLAGPGANILSAFAAACAVCALWGAQTSLTAVSVKAGSPAAEAGITAGSTVLSVGGRSTVSSQDFQEYVLTHPGRTAEIKWKTPDGTVHERAVTPENGIFGLSLSAEASELTAAQVPLCGAETVRYWTYAVWDSLGMLVRGDAPLSDMAGAVGVADVMSQNIGEARQQGSSAFAETVCVLFVFLSVNLGLMNLIPLPALDGGQAAVSIAETVSRKKVPPALLRKANGAGLAVLTGLMCVLLVHDIGNLIR